MTNENKAKEFYHKYRESHLNLAPESAAFNVALEMAEWKEQQMIDKAVEWLKENTSCYASFDDDIISDTENKNNFINDFKQVMKGK